MTGSAPRSNRCHPAPPTSTRCGPHNGASTSVDAVLTGAATVLVLVVAGVAVIRSIPEDGEQVTTAEAPAARHFLRRRAQRDSTGRTHQRGVAGVGCRARPGRPVLLGSGQGDDQVATAQRLAARRARRATLRPLVLRHGRHDAHLAAAHR